MAASMARWSPCIRVFDMQALGVYIGKTTLL